MSFKKFFGEIGQDFRHPIRRWGYIFMLPGIIYFTVFIAYPLGRTFFLSFHRWRGQKPMLFVGWDNYLTILYDPAFIKSIMHTFYYTFLTVPAATALGLFLAFIFSKKFRFKNFWRTVYFFPLVTSLVAICIVWTWIYQPLFGLLNGILGLFNLPTQMWLRSNTLVIPCVAIVNVWVRIGFNMVIFLAGLTAIPENLYQAAELDGANAWQQFWHITFPLLIPTTIFILIMGTISSLQVFTEIYVMTSGGPAEASSVAAFVIYQTAFKYLRMGIASAMAVVLFAIIMVVSFMQLRFSEKKTVSF